MINTEPKSITKTVTTKESKPATYERVVKEFAKWIKSFDSHLTCCPRINGELVQCKDCKFKPDQSCLQTKLSEVLFDILEVK